MTARLVLSRPLAWCIVLMLFFVPPVAALVYVHLYSTTVPRLDEFAFIIPLLDQVHHGTFPWSDLVKSLYWEHPVFVARPLFLLIALLTHYSTRSFLYVNCFLLGLVALIWYLDYRRILRARGQKFGVGAALAFVPIVWLVFSLRQTIVFLQCITLVEMLSISGIALAFYLLGTSRRLGARFFVAGVVAVMTSGTTTSGLLVWPVGLIHLWWSDRHGQAELRVRKWRLGIWGGLSALVWVAYFSRLEIPVDWFAQDVSRMIPFLLVTAGAPLARHLVWAGALGGLFILASSLMIASMLRRSTEPRHPTIAFPFMIFSIVNAALIAYGRREFSLTVALQDHFTAFTCQGLIGLYLTLATSNGTSARIARLGLLAIIFLALGRATVSAFETGPLDRMQAMRLAYYLRSYRLQPDSLLALLAKGQRKSHPDWVRNGAPILERLKLNLFSEPSPFPPEGPPSPDQARFAVERVNGRPLHQGAATVEQPTETACEIEGWAIDSKLQTRAKGVFLQLDDGKHRVPAQYGLERSDVANPALRYTGFYISFDPRLLGVGRHRAALQIVAADDHGYYLSEGFDLAIR